MKKTLTLFLVLMLPLVSVASLSQAASIDPQPLPIRHDEFVDKYNIGLKGLDPLSLANGYNVGKSNSLVLPADEADDVSIIFQTDSNGACVITTVTLRRDFGKFESYLAVVDRALSLLAPNSTETERNTAIMDVVAGGITREALQEYGQNTAMCGEDYLLVYYYEKDLRKMAIIKGELVYD